MKTRSLLLPLIALFGAATLFAPTVLGKEKEKKKEEVKRSSPLEQLWQAFQDKNPGLVAPRREAPPRENPKRQVQLSVINNTGSPVSLVWQQPYAGQVNYGALPPDGQPRIIGTFPGHIWIFKVGYDVVGRYEVTGDAQQEIALGGGRRGRVAALPPPPVQYPPRAVPVPVIRGAGGAAGRAAFLQVHNEARAAKGVAPLEWSADCAAIAQEWAQRLADRDAGLVHSGRQDFGENVWQASGGNPSAADAADDWLSERTAYRGEPITQANFARVGHYTQMVWSGTSAVGYGYARAASGNVYIVANYFPPGNFLGQRPYGR